MILVLFSFFMCGDGLSAKEREERRTKQYGLWDSVTQDRLPLMGLPVDGQPKAVISLNLNHMESVLYPSDPRLAVLYHPRNTSDSVLGIFEPQDGKFMPIFTLKPGKEDLANWDEMHQFPSEFLPGVVLWGSIEHIREVATVVCYANREFRVVFRGIDATFLDIDGDSIPEIFSDSILEFDPDHDPSTKQFLVHTWNGSEFVLAAKVRDWRYRFSDEIIEAVKQVKKESVPPTSD